MLSELFCCRVGRLECVTDRWSEAVKRLVSSNDDDFNNYIIIFTSIENSTKNHAMKSFSEKPQRSAVNDMTIFGNYKLVLP